MTISSAHAPRWPFALETPQVHPASGATPVPTAPSPLPSVPTVVPPYARLLTQPGPPPAPGLQSARDSVSDWPAARCTYEICCPAYVSADGVHTPVLGTIAAFITCTVSCCPGPMVALT